MVALEIGHYLVLVYPPLTQSAVETAVLDAISVKSSF